MRQLSSYIWPSKEGSKNCPCKSWLPEKGEWWEARTRNQTRSEVSLRSAADVCSEKLRGRKGRDCAVEKTQLRGGRGNFQNTMIMSERSEWSRFDCMVVDFISLESSLEEWLSPLVVLSRSWARPQHLPLLVPNRADALGPAPFLGGYSQLPGQEAAGTNRVCPHLPRTCPASAPRWPPPYPQHRDSWELSPQLQPQRVQVWPSAGPLGAVESCIHRFDVGLNKPSAGCSAV